MARTEADDQNRTLAIGSESERFGIRLALTLLALLWPAQLYFFSGIAVGLSTAAVAQQMHTTQVIWLTLIMSLVGALVTPFITKAGDVFGRKRVMLAIIAVSLIGDIVTAAAPNYQIMLLGRGIASLYVPITALAIAAVRDVFPPRHIGLAGGSIGATMGLVILIGGLVAAQMLDAFGFRAVFWVVVAGAAVALVLVQLFVPEIPGTGERSHFDWAGGLTLGAAAAVLIYSLGLGATFGWTSVGFLGLVALGVLLLVAFVLVERRAVHPLLDLRVLARRDVASVLAATSIGQGISLTGGTMLVYLATYPAIPGVSDALGWSVTKMVVVTLPCGIAFQLAGMMAGRMASRRDPRLPWIGGLVLMFAGFITLAWYHHTELQILLFVGLQYIGGGMVMACTPLLLMSVVDPEVQGAASGMQLTISNLMNALTLQVMFIALAVGGTVVQGTAFYRDSGYHASYLVMAGFTVAVLVISALLPKIRPSSQISSGFSREKVSADRPASV